MIRFPALLVMSLFAVAAIVGCADQPLDAPVGQQITEDAAPSPPVAGPVVSEDGELSDPLSADAPGEFANDPPAKSPLRSIFNALKVGTAEALDETATP